MGIWQARAIYTRYGYLYPYDKCRSGEACIIFIFCATIVVQNMTITQEFPSSASAQGRHLLVAIHVERNRSKTQRDSNKNGARNGSREDDAKICISMTHY